MTEQEAPRRLLVLAGPAEHQIAVSELPESGELVVDDLTEATRIGDLNGDAQPLVLTIDGERYVIVGGSAPGGDPWDRVEIRSPGPSPRLHADVPGPQRRLAELPRTVQRGNGVHGHVLRGRHGAVRT